MPRTARKADAAHGIRTAVILAGGLGTRLRPLTLETPKPLIPVQGRTLTEQVLDLLKEHGVTHVILSIGHMADKIKAHFGDGARFGVRISYLIEEEPLGTGGWMRLLQEQRLVPESEFIVVNGDNLFDIDFTEMLALHRRQRASVTIALTAVEDVEHYGVVAMEGQRIVRFIEKPARSAAPSNLINGGYYIFSPAAFQAMPPQKAFMLEKELFPQLAAEGKVAGYVSKAQWFDTGTFERWEKVEKEWRTVGKKR